MLIPVAVVIIVTYAPTPHPWKWKENQITLVTAFIMLPGIETCFLNVSFSNVHSVQVTATYTEQKKKQTLSTNWEEDLF